MKLANGRLVAATVCELRNYFTLLFNSPADPAVTTIGGGPVPGPVVYLTIACEKVTGFLTYPATSGKTRERGQEAAVVVYEDELGALVETSPAQFELRAECSAKKWRCSFKAVGEHAKGRPVTVCDRSGRL